MKSKSTILFRRRRFVPIFATITFLSEDNKLRDEVQKVFRNLASELCPKVNIIPWFKIWELLKIVPRFQDVTAATSELIGLSNSIHDVNVNFNKIRREKIQKLLNIKIVEK